MNTLECMVDREGNKTRPAERMGAGKSHFHGHKNRVQIGPNVHSSRSLPTSCFIQQPIVVVLILALGLSDLSQRSPIRATAEQFHKNHSPSGRQQHSESHLKLGLGLGTWLRIVGARSVQCIGARPTRTRTDKRESCCWAALKLFHNFLLALVCANRITAAACETRNTN